MPRLGKVRRVAWRFEPLSSVEPIALVRLQSDTMCSGLQFSSLIRAGLGVCLELSTFLRSSVQSRSALLAENLFGCVATFRAAGWRLDGLIELLTEVPGEVIVKDFSDWYSVSRRETSMSPQLQHSAFDPCGNQTRLLKYYEREAA